MENLQEISMFTLFYMLMCGCIIYPPIEFLSSGLTIEAIFATLLQSEAEQFVLYHIKRSILNLFIYSLLPLGYVLGLWLFNYDEEVLWLWSYDRSVLFQLFTTSAFILPLLALYQIKIWSRDNWLDHPIVKNMKKFCNNNSDWLTVSSDVNNEFRRIDKICIQTNAICKVVATENWIMKVTPLTIFIIHQSDASLEVNQSDTHYISQDNSGHVQYVNIRVKSRREHVDPFTIRLNALDFKDLSDRVARTIVVLPNVNFHKTLMDKFIDAFKDVIKDNSTYICQQELENCIGCMQSRANVKLQKLCIDNGDESCVTCYCRPMWCIECMARWFASRQDNQHPETWLASKCTCPMCRATFCVLDVSLVEEVN